MTLPEPFAHRLALLTREHRHLIDRPNARHPEWNSGVFDRFLHPVVTAAHAPLHWRFDLDPETNPRLIERLGVNATFNSGAIELDGRVFLMVRVEGVDRKSFFALAESATGVDGFRFRDEPIVMPDAPGSPPDTNVYDMRLTAHEDGHIYGLFCTERKDTAKPHDLSAAIAQCGIARTRDLRTWERLPDLKTRSAQQRNVVLHPRFVGGKYALYTRPQDDFMAVGAGGGIGFCLCDDMSDAAVSDERIIEPRVYHTVKEYKNGQGPPPLPTPRGWLHLAHGTRPAKRRSTRAGHSPPTATQPMSISKCTALGSVFATSRSSA